MSGSELAAHTIPGAANPFAVLTLIAAPALLTNAACLLAMSTSNRFLRVSDRIRMLATKLQTATGEDLPALRIQVDRVERQGLLLLSGLRSIYVSVGSFAGASLTSVIGASLAESHVDFWFRIAVGVALLAGLIGFGGLMWSSINLMHATRLSMMNIAEEAAHIRKCVARETKKTDGPRTG